MACGIATIEASMEAAKATALTNLAGYQSQLNSLKNINPDDYASREAFENAKASAIADVKSQLDVYKTSLTEYTSISGQLNAIKAAGIEQISDLFSSVFPTDIQGIGDIAGLVDALKSLQC